MTNIFGKFDCWIYWKNDKSCRMPLDIPAINYYRRIGVDVHVVGEYNNFNLFHVYGEEKE